MFRQPGAPRLSTTYLASTATSPSGSDAWKAMVTTVTSTWSAIRPKLATAEGRQEAATLDRKSKVMGGPPRVPRPNGGNVPLLRETLIKGCPEATEKEKAAQRSVP